MVYEVVLIIYQMNLGFFPGTIFRFLTEVIVFLRSFMTKCQNKMVKLWMIICARHLFQKFWSGLTVFWTEKKYVYDTFLYACLRHLAWKIKSVNLFSIISHAKCLIEERIIDYYNALSKRRWNGSRCGKNSKFWF